MGVRRFQNPDGTLTPAGRERYRKIKTKDFGQFEKYVYEDCELLDNNEFFKSYMNSKQSENVRNKSEQFKKDGEFFIKEANKYSKKLEKDRGKEWDGDGSEEHDEMMRRYKGYRDLYTNFEKKKNDLLDTIKSASKNGELNNIVARDLDLSSKYSTYMGDGKSAVLAILLDSKYKFIDNISPYDFIEFHSNV